MGVGIGCKLRVRKTTPPPNPPPPPRGEGDRTRRVARSAAPAMRSAALHPAPPNRNSFAPSNPIGPCVAARIMPPPARWLRMSTREHRLRRRIERRGRLVQQPERAIHRDQPRDRQPPPLAGGKIGGGKVAMPPSPTPSSAGDRGVAAEIARPERSFRDGERQLERVLVAQIVRLLAEGGVAVAAFKSSRPAASRTRPATSRSSEDLPAPFGPLTSRASPAPTAKLRPENTCRPPRTQARSEASSRVGRRFARIRASCRRRAAAARRAGPKPATGPWKSRHFRRILLTRIDFLEQHKKRPYKPVHPGARPRTPGCRDRRPGAIR